MIAMLGCGGGSVDPVGTIECTEEGESSQHCDIAAGEKCCPRFEADSTCEAACDNGGNFACDGPEDCAEGEVCCVTNMTTAACAVTCDGPGDNQMCHTGGECPVEDPCCLPIRLNGVLLTFCNSSDLPSCR